MLEILRTLLAIALLAFVAQSAFASNPDDARDTPLETASPWHETYAEFPTSLLLPEEPESGIRTTVQIGLGLLMVVLIACGFTLAITSLRADIRQRRSIYHQRLRT